MKNSFDTINPTTEKIIQSYLFYSDNQIKEIIDDTFKAQETWRKLDIDFRSKCFNHLAKMMTEQKHSLAELITMEMGKPIREGVREIEKCVWVCQHYAETSEAYLKPENIQSDAVHSEVVFNPLGVILAVMPWNLPFWQVFRFAAPTMMAGNCCLLKHAPNTTACGLAIERLFTEAGFPQNSFRTIIADIPQLESIVANKKIAAVTLTGSTNAGKSLAQLSGKYLKKIVLELGGNDPYLILDDADLDLAVEKCITSRLLNAGQVCIAAKRIIVTHNNLQEFNFKLIEKLKTKKVGNPLDEDSDIGPLARLDLKSQLETQVADSINKGAQLAFRSDIPKGDGYYFPITVLTHVQPNTPSYDDELFGPVFSIIEAKDEADAISIANNTNFGLGSAIFSRNTAKALQIARNELSAGCCFINDFVKSDPRLPFGGIKESGYGRELAAYGIKEFVNIKTIYQQ